MKQILFIILTIFGLHSHCLAAGNEINLENGVAAPILVNVHGANVHHDDAPTAPHRNYVHTPLPQDELAVMGTLMQPDTTLIRITCGRLSGKGFIEGDNIDISSDFWGFNGTIFCGNVCTITTRSSIETLRLNTVFMGVGRIIVKRVNQDGQVINAQEFNANP